MIDLGSINGLHEHGHQLAAYCQHCDRWEVLPLAELIAAGHGSRRLPIRVRCRVCGEVVTTSSFLWDGACSDYPPVQEMAWPVIRTYDLTYMFQPPFRIR